MSKIRRKIVENRNCVMAYGDAEASVELNRLMRLESDMILKPENLPHQVPDYDPDKEKWVDLDGTCQFFLRMEFGNEEAPVTEVNFFYIKSSNEEKFVSYSLLTFYRQSRPTIRSSQ